MIKRFGSLLLLGAVLHWTACGAGPKNTAATPGGGTPTPTPTPAPGGGNTGGQLTTPAVISVGGGQSVVGADINVPATSPPLNATMLGVNPASATTLSASNTGGAVARGSSAVVLMFGTGLAGDVQVSISGPNDINIGTVRHVTANNSDKTPGLEFTVDVPANAGVGARTVIIKDASSNVTTFTGGLEVF